MTTMTSEAMNRTGETRTACASSPPFVMAFEDDLSEWIFRSFADHQ